MLCAELFVLEVVLFFFCIFFFITLLIPNESLGGGAHQWQIIEILIDHGFLCRKAVFLLLGLGHVLLFRHRLHRDIGLSSARADGRQVRGM